MVYRWWVARVWGVVQVGRSLVGPRGMGPGATSTLFPHCNPLYGHCSTHCTPLYGHCNTHYTGFWPKRHCFTGFGLKDTVLRVLQGFATVGPTVPGFTTVGPTVLGLG